MVATLVSLPSCYLWEGNITATRPELRHSSRMRQTRSYLLLTCCSLALLAYLDGSDLRYGLDGSYALDLDGDAHLALGLLVVLA